jgi:tRNA1Val (adenine37-N6)-methyltransferase
MTTQIAKTHRFVPVGAISSSDDAPGWSPDGQPVSIVSKEQVSSSAPAHKENEEDIMLRLGPICWKCRGSGRHHWKYTAEQLESLRCRAEDAVDPSNRAKKRFAKMKLAGDLDAKCTVCHGRGRQVVKKPELDHKETFGEVTSPRKHNDDWVNFGPQPHALWAASRLATQQSSALHDSAEECNCAVQGQLIAAKIFSQIEETGKSVFIDISNDIFPPCAFCRQDKLAESEGKHSNIPAWIPLEGEQLCNLVGSWRILQRVGSHRWTTDDLVTAAVASKRVEQIISKLSSSKAACVSAPPASSFHYLDLGCGNGFVLSMTMWKLCQVLNNNCDKFDKLEARGIEARQEAVELNRRSLSFNVGDKEGSDDTCLRQQSSTSPGNDSKANNVFPINAKVLHGDFRECLEQHETKFHLVTGTPPYFRVDFKVDDQDKNNTTTTAVIRQGGMPTSKQSAPARCEFRGGIEAYCQAAASCLRDDGYFVVCENWANHDRVLQSAVDAKLRIVSIQPVKGNTQKLIPLFAVYTMQLRREAEAVSQIGSDESIPTAGGQESCSDLMRSAFCVRNETGKWTLNYAKEVLEYMSIPAMHNAESS